MYPGPVALSQFMISHHLDKLSDLPVFSDSIEQDLTLEDVGADSENDRVEKYIETFPNGVPELFGQLTVPQKEVLIEEGGAMIALLSGRLTTLYTAINGSEHEKAFDHEREALNGINAYFTLYPEVKTVVLVLGARFDLTRHWDQFNPECIETPAEIKGAHRAREFAN